jgi:3-oxoacyl-[acyl-carrier-protein] synthase II
MQMALRNAGLDPENIDYINAHGTSTPQGDICETRAVRKVFKEHADSLVVNSTKGATGHMLGAAGAVEMILTAKALQNGIAPPTINLEIPDPECDLDYVPNEAREMEIDAALSNSFGFGGHNATIAATKFTGYAARVD